MTIKQQSDQSYRVTNMTPSAIFGFLDWSLWKYQVTQITKLLNHNLIFIVIKQFNFKCEWPSDQEKPQLLHWPHNYDDIFISHWATSETKY